MLLVQRLAVPLLLQVHRCMIHSEAPPNAKMGMVRAGAAVCYGNMAGASRSSTIAHSTVTTYGAILRKMMASEMLQSGRQVVDVWTCHEVAGRVLAPTPCRTLCVSTSCEHLHVGYAGYRSSQPPLESSKKYFSPPTDRPASVLVI